MSVKYFKFLRASIFLLCFLPVLVFSAVPETLNYQGYLQQKIDGVFKPAADGNYSVTFKLYDVATGGIALWDSTKTVVVVDGIYSTVLGQDKALTGLGFDKPYYLGITVGSDIEMEPRQAITASAYAVQAKKTEKVGALISGKWCNSDGNVINCTESSPSGGGITPKVAKLSDNASMIKVSCPTGTSTAISGGCTSTVQGFFSSSPSCDTAATGGLDSCGNEATNIDGWACEWSGADVSNTAYVVCF